MNQTQLTKNFEAALNLTFRLHGQQVRKADGTPYIAHLLSVAALVLEDGGSETEAIAALLHDAIEDQGGEATRQTILEGFGEEVTAIVEGCTESIDVPKPPWRDRKLHYLEKIRNGNPSVVRVSFADKLHNGRSLLFQLQRQGTEVWRYFHQPSEDILWFYQELLDVYQQRAIDVRIKEFSEIISCLSEFLER